MLCSTENRTFRLFIIVNGYGVTFGILITIAGLFCSTVVLLNIFGIILGFAMKSNPEVHLIGALSTGFIALISDLFPLPERLDRLVTTINRWNPLTLLFNYLLGLGQITANVEGNSILLPVIIIIAFITLILWRSFDWREFS